jgi:hypothetical protein
LHLGEAEVQIHICQSFSEHPQRWCPHRWTMHPTTQCKSNFTL